MRMVASVGACACFVLACGPPLEPPAADAGTAEVAFFPLDVEQAFAEVRDCRQSIDHDLTFIRVFADAAAFGPYSTRAAAFPAESVVAKVEYVDDACATRAGFAAMKKRPVGEDVDAGDWRWQRADADGSVTESGAPQRCVTCHRACGEPPDGYDWTCAADGG
jgi:hypothetical protein